MSFLDFHFHNVFIYETADSDLNQENGSTSVAFISLLVIHIGWYPKKTVSSFEGLRCVKLYQDYQLHKKTSKDDKERLSLQHHCNRAIQLYLFWLCALGKSKAGDFRVIAYHGCLTLDEMHLMCLSPQSSFGEAQGMCTSQKSLRHKVQQLRNYPSILPSSSPHQV